MITNREKFATINRNISQLLNTNRFFQDVFISNLTGKFSIDVIRLDEWLHKTHGYVEEKHGSMKDFIKATFGDRACKYISELLE